MILTEKCFGKQKIISGQGEAAKQLVSVAIDKIDPKLIWLYSDAAHIYNGFPFPNDSRGMAGAIIPFTTIDGKIILLFGPWHSNTDTLYARTGVDLRDQHITRGLVALKRDWTQNDFEYSGILYLDKEGTAGKYHRILEIGKRFAQELSETVFVFTQTNGGSCHAVVER